LLTLALPRTASAHALGAECKVVGGRAEVTAYYDDDTPAIGARVRVLDAGKATVAEGSTDAQGRWTFPLPPPGAYQVVVDAGMGHLARVKVVVPATSAEGTLSTGPGREEFTRAPWLKVGIGLGAIGLFCLALWLARRRPRTGS